MPDQVTAGENTKTKTENQKARHVACFFINTNTIASRGRNNRADDSWGDNNSSRVDRNAAASSRTDAGFDRHLLFHSPNAA
jgi:hypothetical protein